MFLEAFLRLQQEWAPCRVRQLVGSASNYYPLEKTLFSLWFARENLRNIFNFFPMFLFFACAARKIKMQMLGNSIRTVSNQTPLNKSPISS